MANDILVVDVESTCWQDKTPPPGEVSEIIEIGALMLEAGKTLDILVRPQFSRVSPFCAGLTGITQEDVDKGILLAEACERLKVEMSSDKVALWASYGDYDRNQFDRNCRLYHIPSPFVGSHLNIKALVASAMGWRKEVGMARALSILGLELEGRHHRAGDDARNITRMFSSLIKAGKYKCQES